MKRLLVILSALLLIVAVSCSNDTPAAPSAGLDGADISITIPSVDEDNVVPDEYAAVYRNLITAVGVSADVGSYSSYTNGYDAEGNRIYSEENDVYTVGIAGDVLKVGDEVEYEGGEYITVNGRQYKRESKTGADYINDFNDMMNNRLVDLVSSRKADSTYRRLGFDIPVLDDEGKMTADTEKITVTVDCSSLWSLSTTTYANGEIKRVDTIKTTYDLSKAANGITSMTMYEYKVSQSEDGSNPMVSTYVLEVTHDGETSAYAYYY